MKKTIINFALLGAFSIIAIPTVDAGTLYPTSQPGESMYSLQEIYDLITSATTAQIGNGSSITVPEVAGSMVTLTELYNAVLALTQEEEIVDEDPELEDLTNHDNISISTFVSSATLETYTQGRYYFQFDVTAIDKDLYIKKDINEDYVLLESLPVATQVTSMSSIMLEMGGTDVDGYFVVPAGTTKTFRQQVHIDNTGSTAKTVALGLDMLEYKVQSISAGLRILDLDQNEFETEGLPFRSTNE
jgi:hypothetical protein